MGHHSRIRRAAKWGGVMGCGLVVVVFAAARTATWCHLSLPGDVGISVLRGGLIVYRWSKPAPETSWAVDLLVSAGPAEAAFASQLVRALEGAQWWPAGWCYWPDWGITIPLWLLFLAFAAPTAFLWWRDRRFPLGHCQRCGYNLTGNVSGRCPECGTATSTLDENKP